MLLSRRASILSSTLFRRTFYDSKTKNDTIFATATSASSNKGSPLAVIRISGAKTSNILNEITQKQAPKPRHATLTKILDPRTRELVDSGLVLWFPRPNSYTGEDVCELHLHGSHAIVTKMLTTLGSVWPGVRPAEPGEFTRRAVMNGKMSLMQAESLPDLIKSHTDSQRRLALNGLDGSTREKYDQWTEKLVGILAHLEASIDFGEDELLGERAVVSQCIEELKRLAEIVDNYIEASARCRDFVVDGVSIAILGKPNAGKSTFMNLLCRRDLSIVSDLSGTTRDLVRHSIEIGGHSVILCDTAGLKNLASGDDESTKTETLLDRHRSIEQEGIRRALEAARKADVLIYLVDGSTCRPNSEFVKQINSELGAALEVICSGSEEFAKPKVLHLIMNKIDLNVHLKSDNCMIQLKEMMKKKLEQQQNEQQQQRSLCVADISLISCKTQENFDQFACTLVERLDELCSPPAATSVKANGPVQFDYVNQRHLSLLKSMHRHLELASRMDLDTIDMMAQHVRESIDYLSRIVGSITSEDVIDVIFRDFCIGK